MSFPFHSRPFREIKEKINEGEFKHFNNLLRDQDVSSQNTLMTFVTQKDKEIKAYVKWDQTTNQIYPPVISLVNWDLANIFSEDLKHLPKISAGYCDEEIEGKVLPESLNSIFEEIGSFQTGKHRYFLKTAETINGEQPAFVREWSSKDQQTRLQLWITNANSDGDEQYNTDDGWAILYGSPTTFLTVGIYNAHPFVHTPKWTFDNSDGSTFISLDPCALSFDQIKTKLHELCLEFVFDQGH